MSMEVKTRTLLEIVEQHVRELFANRISPDFTYHDLHHTFNVVEAVQELAALEGIGADEIRLLTIAAWFHDTGYDRGRFEHEVRSADYARTFLREQDYPEEQIGVIEACIRATYYPQRPKNKLEALLCDADLSHLGQSNYWERCGLVRQEMIMVDNRVMSDLEWVNFELEFMNSHRYHTEAARQLYQKNKTKHIRQLVKQKARLSPHTINPVEAALLEKKSKKSKKDNLPIPNENAEIKQLRLGRGVETMYRTTYRTHINLSSIADNKANIMLSINAIIISITLSTLVPEFGLNSKLVFPTLLLLAVCLVSIVFATLSTMPKVTEGIFSREDIRQKKSNLLFFGNFYNMEMEDFHWGMMEMIKDSDFLYSSMTRDLFFLGKVLAKKYRYLRICYRIFMYGLIAVTLAFAFVFGFG